MSVLSRWTRGGRPRQRPARTQ